MKKNIYEKINRKKDEKSMKELRGKMTKRYVKGMGFYDFYVCRRGNIKNNNNNKNNKNNNNNKNNTTTKTTTTTTVTVATARTKREY